ncbi:hypothetical protein N7540_004476 [Penicillium herquei]|nr:hypothetical protein N7540_004476 [Penicillium herquei]
MSPVNPGSTKYICRSVNPFSKYCTIRIGLVVNTVLDSAILNKKAAELIGKWPILGGRLLKNTKPWSFTCGSNVDYESRSIDQSLATYIPLKFGPKDKPRIVQGPDMTEVDEKFTFNIPLRSDIIFRLRVTTLRDATLLCFEITHHLCDGADILEVIKAFCNLLSHKPIPSFVLPPDAEGVRLSDMMIVKTESNNANGEVESYYRDHDQNFDSGVFKLGRLLYRVIFTELAVKVGLMEELTTKFIHIPSAWVDKLHTKSNEELRENSPSIELTRNDILAAWYLKTIYSPQTISHGTVDYYGPVNFRPFIDPPKAGTQYIRNSIGIFRCKFSVEQLQRESVGNIARAIHMTTLRYRQPASVEQFLRFSENNTSKNLAVRARSGGNLAFVGMSPLTRFDFAGLDFSGASIERAKASVILFNPLVSIPLNAALGPIAIVAKDGLGDYWIRAANNSTGWENLDRSSRLENLFPSR